MATAVSSRSFSTRSRSYHGVVVSELLPSSSITLPKPSPYLQSLYRLPRPSLTSSSFNSHRKGHVSRRDSDRLTGRTREVRPALQRPQARERHRENSRYQSPRHRSDMGSSFPSLRMSSGDRFGSDRQRYGSPQRPLTTRQASPFSRAVKRETSSVCGDRRNVLARQSTAIRPERSNSSTSRQGLSVSRKQSAHKLSMRKYLYGNSVDIDPYTYYQNESIAHRLQEQSVGYDPLPLPEVKHTPFRRQPKYAAYAASFRMSRNKDQVNHIFKYSHSVMCALNGMTQEEETKPYPQARGRQTKKSKVQVSTFEIPQDVLVKLHKDNTLRISMTPGSPGETKNQSTSDVRSISGERAFSNKSTSRERTFINESTSRERAFSNGSTSRERTFYGSTSRERTFSNASSGSERVSSQKVPRKNSAAGQTMILHKSARSSARKRDESIDQVTPIIRIN